MRRPPLFALLTLVLLGSASTTPIHAIFAGTDIFLPSVGARPGVPPSVWYTTVWVHNPNPTAANVTFYLLERKANLSPRTAADTIPAGDTRRYDNAVKTLFGVEEFGAIRVNANVKVMVGSRIYSATGTLDESAGQFFAGTPASFAIGAGESTEVMGVWQTLPSGASDFRYNFGFVETTGTGTCSVQVQARDHTGASLGSKSYLVREWEQVQKGFAVEFPGVSTDNARLTVTVTSGSGRVIAFGSQVANASQDPSTFEMSFADSLLAENSPGGGITGVAAGAGLAGGGTSGTVTLSVANSGIIGTMIAEGAVTAPKIGANQVVTGVNGLRDGVTLEAGANVTITPGGNTLTFSSSGMSLPYAGTGSAAHPNAAFQVDNGGTGVAIMGLTTGFAGVIGLSSGTGSGVEGRSYQGHGMAALTEGDSGWAVYGRHIQSGNEAFIAGRTLGLRIESSGIGILGRSSSASMGAIRGEQSSTGNVGEVGSIIAGVVGAAYGAGYGVHGIRGDFKGNLGDPDGGVLGIHEPTGNYALLGRSSAGIRARGYGTPPLAGQFVGNVDVQGNLTKSSGSFKIDHPLDPEGMYLYHSFVESPDMMNVYNGNVVLDGTGHAWVELPEWLEALNRDFRYQLTCIGGFAPVYIAEEIAGNRFRIAGGRPGLKVSWQVTGIRQDAFANVHRIPVEEIKPPEERGLYLHPEVWGQPEERGVAHVTAPEVERQVGERQMETRQP